MVKKTKSQKQIAKMILEALKNLTMAKFNIGILPKDLPKRKWRITLELKM